jgi:hypothetical protein
VESIKKIEDMVEGWLKPIPHLPTNWRKWISDNIWWITLVGVILSVIGLFGLLIILLGAVSFFGTTSVFYGAYVPAAYSGVQLFAGFVQLLFLVATVAITAMAVMPLRLMRKKGWDLLFLSFLVGIVAQIVGAVLMANPSGIITTLLSDLIGAAISAYFLFEVRSYFKDKKA